MVCHLKIIILLRILWTAGAQKIAIKEAKELSLLGHDVELIFLRGRELPEYEDMLVGVKYAILSETGRSLFSPIYSYITKRFAPGRGNESRVDYNLIKAFPSYLKGKDVDYIICHDLLSGLAGYYSFKKLGIRYSVFVHERVEPAKVPILGKLWQKYEHKILANAISVFAISNKVGDSVMNLHSIEATTNYPGMDTNSVASFDQKENAIIADSFWDYGRRPEIYLDIIAKIPNFVFYLAGNFRIEELEQSVRMKIREKHLENRVFIKKNLRESDLVDLYSKCKFSFRFGFGEYGIGSTMGAIQNSVPLIINSELGISDLVRKYSCGLVLEKIDEMKVQEFISEYNNQTKYGELQQNVTKVSRDYSWKNHVELLVKAI